MTLIIALKVSNGIVMAADGQESIGTGSGIIRAHVSKIEKLGRRAAWAGSGDVTFIQRSRRALDKCIAEKEAAHFSLPGDIDLISDAIVAVRARFLDQANETASDEECDTPTDEREDVPSGELLLAHYSKGVGRIYQVDSRGFETEVDARFVAIGIADVAGYALLRPFTDNDLAAITAAQATPLAYGMISDAIEVSGDLGPPIHVWIIDDKGPRRVLDSEASESDHRATETHQAVEAAWAEYSRSCKAKYLELAGKVPLAD